ncbi:MAG: BatB protein, partial [Gammaproteobacteria bacterium]|nr:BatB protein [Gammaproteobacteria bacterium]
METILGISFAWWWLVCVLPLPALVHWILPPSGQRAAAGLVTPFYRDLFAAQSQPSSSRRRRRWAILCIIWGCLVLAAMRPQAVADAVELPLSGRDLMLAVDLSMSMGEPDFVIG